MTLPINNILETGEWAEDHWSYND